MANPICKCGHYKSIHHFFDNGDSFCTDLAKEIRKSCLCRKYRLDNLRFLEQKANDPND